MGTRIISVWHAIAVTDYRLPLSATRNVNFISAKADLLYIRVVCP